MQVEGQREQSLLCLPATGARVSNAYATFPRQGDSPGKLGLIPRRPDEGILVRLKFRRSGVGMRAIRQLVG